MQLTGPVFLFVFLPLSFPLILFIPKSYRRLALSLLSVVWYILANIDNLFGILHIMLLLLFAVLLAYLPPPRSIKGAQIRTVLGIALPLLSFVGARIVAEYGSDAYVYPAGLAFVTLGVISYTIDFTRGDVIRPRNPLDLIGYLLFFPILMMGPVIRSKQYFDATEEITVTPELFCTGIRYYMLGYIKRIALAAVLLRTIENILSSAEIALPWFSLLLLFALSYLFFYFFVTGCADMARGVCAMYGIRIPRDKGNLLFAGSPDRLLYGTLLSFRNYLLDYVGAPLRRRCHGKGGSALVALLIFVLTVLFLRTRPEMLLFALPLLLFSLFPLISPDKRVPRSRLLRLFGSLCSAVLCSFLTLTLLLDRPMQLFSLFSAVAENQTHYLPYHIFNTTQDATYLALAITLVALLLVLSYLRDLLLPRASERTRFIVLIVTTLFLFVGFVISLIYFMPQFPAYAHKSYAPFPM